jgi:hypothetical protein
LGDSGDSAGSRAEEIGEVVCGGLTFDVGAEREDCFGWGGGEGSGEKGVDAKGFWADAVQGGEAASEGVVEAIETCGAFEGEDVGRRFHNAE